MTLFENLCIRVAPSMILKKLIICSYVYAIQRDLLLLFFFCYPKICVNLYLNTTVLSVFFFFFDNDVSIFI